MELNYTASIQDKKQINTSKSGDVTKKFRCFRFHGDFAKIQFFPGQISKIYKHKELPKVYIICFENAVRIDKHNTDPTVDIEPFHIRGKTQSFSLIGDFNSEQETLLCDLEIEKIQLMRKKKELEEEITFYQESGFDLFYNFCNSPDQ